MTELTRLRALPDPAHLPALKPQYAHVRPALGLGPVDPPVRVLLRPHAAQLVDRYSERAERDHPVATPADKAGIARG